MALAMDGVALNAFLTEHFPQLRSDFAVDRVDEDLLVARLAVGQDHLRPGGTVSGPSMFALADLSIYTAILSRIGPVALVVTTNASIDFMRKPEPDRDLLAHCRILKLGRALAVGEALIYSEGQDQPVARSSMTYSIPPERKEFEGLR